MLFILKIQGGKMKQFKLKKTVLSLIICTLLIGNGVSTKTKVSAYEPDPPDCTSAAYHLGNDDEEGYCEITWLDTSSGYAEYRSRNIYGLSASACVCNGNNPSPSPSPDNPPAPPKPKIEYRYSKKPVLEAITTDTIQIKGKAGNNAKVTILVNGAKLGETKATATGEFAYRLTKGLKVNDEVKAKGEDPDWGDYRYFVVESDVTKVKGFELKDSIVQTDLTAKDIAAMEEKIKNLKNDVTQANVKIVTLEKEMEKLKDKHSNEILKLQEIINRLKLEKEELFKEIQYLSKLLQEKESNIKDLEVKIKVLEEKNKSLEDKIKELEKQIRDLQQENLSLKEQIKGLLEKIKLLEHNLGTCKADSKAKQELIDKIKKELEEAKKQITLLLEDKSKNEKEKAEELKKLWKKLEELEKKEAELRDLGEKLKTQQEANERKYYDNETGTAAGDYEKRFTSQQEFEEYLQQNGGSGNDLSKDGELNNSDNKRKIRYPNKLTPKAPPENSDTDGSGQKINRNKGIASDPSKARADLIENVNNSNEEYPIHKRLKKTATTSSSDSMYSADARQFITFKTKSGKTFHLIINHDEKSENVQLLTEVNEDDLLNMMEKKEVKPVEPKPVVTVEKKEEKPVKEEEASNLGLYLLMGILVASGVGGLLYYKKMKAKEAAELKEFDNEEAEDIEYEDDLMSESEATPAVSQENQEE